MTLWRDWLSALRSTPGDDRRIADYYERRLAPALGLRPMGAPLRRKSHRRVYLVESARERLIVRFYLGDKARLYARNAALAADAFGRLGVPTPPTLYCDLAEGDPARRPLCCVAQPFLAGEPFAPAHRAARLRALCVALARLHAQVAERHGRLAAPEQTPWTKTGWRPATDATLRRLRKAGGAGLLMRRSVWRWFAARPAPAPDEGPFGLTHGDLLPDNVLVQPDGAVALIDLDRAARAPAGFELAHLVTRFVLEPADWQDCADLRDFWRRCEARVEEGLAPYFELASPAARDHWQARRDLWIAWGFLAHASRLRRPEAALRAILASQLEEAS